MIKSILYLISLYILCISFTLKAEEITLESLHSTQGAKLNCKKDQLELGIYGEPTVQQLKSQKEKIDLK